MTTDIVEAVPDCLLFDTDQKLTRPNMLAAWAAGARGMVRYVGFADAPFPGDLDGEELEGLLTLGYGVMVAQHVREGLWTPSAAMGTADGQNGVRHTLAAGVARGVSFWDDLEAIDGTADATVAYANAKHEAVIATYLQGEYVGDRVPLGGHALFARLASDRYWRSLSDVPDVDHRGYCMTQMRGAPPSFGVVVGGVTYDVNYHTADRLGGRAMWMRRVA